MSRSQPEVRLAQQPESRIYKQEPNVIIFESPRCARTSPQWGTQWVASIPSTSSQEATRKRRETAPVCVRFTIWEAHILQIPKRMHIITHPQECASTGSALLPPSPRAGEPTKQILNMRANLPVIKLYALT